jgi:hypothetical protein
MSIHRTCGPKPITPFGIHLQPLDPVDERLWMIRFQNNTSSRFFHSKCRFTIRVDGRDDGSADGQIRRQFARQ